VGFVVYKVALGRFFLSVVYFRGADGRIILNWIFRKWVGGAWTGLIWLRIGTGKCGEFLD
jgi:hypothetical protein